MIHLSLSESEKGTLTSCVLNQNSLTEMANLDPLFCIGWILGAMGSWIARSNRPGSVRVETDAIFSSIKVHLPAFETQELEQLFLLPCLTSRRDYLQSKLAASAPELPINGTPPGTIGKGWATFQYFHSLGVVPDAENIEFHLSVMTNPPWIAGAD